MSRDRANGSLRIGVGAGTADDRIEPAGELAEKGELDYLVFECLAERTVARENLALSRDPERGYTPRLLERMERVLPACMEQGIRVVTNMGAANPLGAAKALRAHVKGMGLGDLSCAVVLGDEVSETLKSMPELPLLENGEPLESILPNLVSADAYLGADIVAAALDRKTPVVITGRVADPSLVLAPALHHFGWDYDDHELMGAATVFGHLLECSAQVNGGCFADPGKKEVPDLARLGYPLGDIAADGSAIIGKVDGSGGLVSVATCTEQLLYEIHDPGEYITPDCVVDITGVELGQIASNRVSVRGATARPRTPTYKVTVGYFDGYIGEGQVSYAGTNAVARAKLAAEVVKERLRLRGFSYSEMRVDLIGMSSLHGMTDDRPEPYEVRLRIAGRTDDRRAAEALGFEVRAMHVHGPAGGGGGSDPSVRDILAVKSVLLPRELVKPEIVVEGRT